MAQRIVRRGTIVLVRYPFTDLSSIKVRPAVVVMSDQLMRKLDDVLCLFISSSMPAKTLSTDFVLEPNHPSFLPSFLSENRFEISLGIQNTQVSASS